VVGIDVRAENDDPFFPPRKLGDDIANRDLARRSLGDKGVFLDLIILQLAVDVFAHLLLARTAIPARPDGNNVLDVLPGACGIDLHRWSSGLQRLRFLSLLPRRGRRWTGDGCGVLPVAAENKCENGDQQPVPTTLTRNQARSPG